jgi:hypothetical protein
MFWADAKATPANSAAVLIKSVFLIRTVPLVVPRVPNAGSGKTKEPLRRFRLQREQIPGNLRATAYALAQLIRSADAARCRMLATSKAG